MPFKTWKTLQMCLFFSQRCNISQPKIYNSSIVKFLDFYTTLSRTLNCWAYICFGINGCHKMQVCSFIDLLRCLQIAEFPVQCGNQIGMCLRLERSVANRKRFCDFDSGITFQVVRESYDPCWFNEKLIPKIPSMKCVRTHCEDRKSNFWFDLNNSMRSPFCISITRC